jgi:DNA replication protein DnaC
MSEDNRRLDEHLKYLKLPFIREHFQSFAAQAAEKQLAHVDYLEKLADGEAAFRRDRSIQRCIQQARFPVIKTLDQFNWSWPKKVNRLQVKNLFRLQFVADKANVIFLGGVGLGKTHLAAALGYQACLEGHSVLFATAIDVINTLTAAQAAGRMKAELKKYTRPAVLILDELGALVITSNRAFKDWPEIFNNDSTLTSAILDRLLHHAETVIVEGKSYRMKDTIES